jgi:hypothetical protein
MNGIDIEEYANYVVSHLKMIGLDTIGIRKRNWKNQKVIDKYTKIAVERVIKDLRELIIDPIQLNPGNLFLSKSLCELK